MPTQPPTRVQPDGTPERLGRYRLVRPISTGGMARVFEARRESLAGVAPRVAIKVILPDFATDASWRELFINEARIGAQLQHQNVVQIQDFDCEGDRYYLVMEYVEGLTLRRMVSLARRQGIEIPLSIIAEMGRQVCDGLYYAHNATNEEGDPLGLVHRDLKPSNLMCNPQGVVKLLDFGISKALASRERKGAVRGTWGYMAPEQAAGRDVCPSTDLFGLAAVIYEMASQQPLFPEKEPEQIRHLLAADEAARRASQLVGAHGALAPVLIRALQRDTAARYTNAADMGRALGDLVKDPMLSRDRLARFQERFSSMARASSPGVSGSLRSQSTMDNREKSNVTGNTGLPVAVGSRARAEPVRRTRPTRATTVVWQAGLGAGFLGLAVLIIAFVGWRLWMENARRRTPEAVPPPMVVDNPLADFADEGGGAREALAMAEAAAKAAREERRNREEDRRKKAQQTAAADAQAPVDGPRNTPADPQLDPVVVQSVPVPAGENTSPSEVVEVRRAEQTGLMTIGALPRSQVVIDGRFVRYSPVFRYEVEAGSHTVTLIADDGRKTDFKVRVPKGGEIRRVWHFDENRFVSN